mgnify:CR=1 FL=1
MKESMSPKLKLALLNLAFARSPEEQEQLVSRTKLRLADWRAVEKQNLVELNEPVKRKGTFVRLSDGGWLWAREHLTDEIGPRTRRKGKPAIVPQHTVLLENLLAQVARFLSERDVPLTEFVTASAASASSQRVVDAPRPAALTERVRKVALELGGVGQRVLLRDLRPRFADVDRAEFDRALLELQKAERAVLYRLDNTLELTPEDERAALLVAGNPRHVVYLEA